MPKLQSVNITILMFRIFLIDLIRPAELISRSRHSIDESYQSKPLHIRVKKSEILRGCCRINLLIAIQIVVKNNYC